MVAEDSFIQRREHGRRTVIDAAALHPPLPIESSLLYYWMLGTALNWGVGFIEDQASSLASVMAPDEQQNGKFQGC